MRSGYRVLDTGQWTGQEEQNRLSPETVIVIIVQLNDNKAITLE